MQQHLETEEPLDRVRQPQLSAIEPEDLYRAILALRRAGWRVYRAGARNRHRVWPERGGEDLILSDHGVLHLASRAARP